MLKSLSGDSRERINLPNGPDTIPDSPHRLREESRIVHARKDNNQKRALSTKALEDIKELGQSHMALDIHDGLSCRKTREYR